VTEFNDINLTDGSVTVIGVSIGTSSVDVELCDLRATGATSAISTLDGVGGCIVQLDATRERL
jgi:hypothetical protein